MTKNIPDSKKPRPAVYLSAREIHIFVLRALDGIRDRRAMLARNSAERAALAVALATADDSPGHNLKRAITAIRTSMFHCDTLYAMEIIDRQAHDYLRRRVDQLIAGLAALKTTPPDHWIDLQLIPLEAEPTAESEAAAPTVLQGILDRVAKAARFFLPRPSSVESHRSGTGAGEGSATKK
jgi:hypothetical protein